ncbi:MAG: translation initiation factor IF-2, partial [Francisellaceae bacterium]
MSNTTINQLAKIVGVSDKILLEKLKSAGIVKQSGSDFISDEEKNTLLSYIKTGGSSVKKVSLKRSGSQVKLSGQSSKVNIEVRKKRVILKKEEPKEIAKSVESSSLEITDLPSNIISVPEVVIEPVVENIAVKPEKAKVEEITPEKAKVEEINAEKAEVAEINPVPVAAKNQPDLFELPTNIPASVIRQERKKAEAAEAAKIKEKEKEKEEADKNKKTTDNFKKS